MKLSKEILKQLEQDLDICQDINELLGKDGAIKKLVKSLSEQMLEGELTSHLGYEKHSLAGNNSGNNRNGFSKKTVKTNYGEIEITIPRDRIGDFEPALIKKHENKLHGIDDKIISLYAKGVTTRDIKSHLDEIYGIEISATSISNITNKVMETVTEWQARPLDNLYPIVYFDAIHYKVREDGKVKTRAAYTCLGINIDGKKDLLGIWINDSEGANFWLSVLTEIRNRGVNDILIACVDGLKGFPEAINTAFPKTEIQCCVIHQIRNSLRYIASKDQKEFMKDLKEVYQATIKENAELKLSALDSRWGKKYPIVIKSWRNNWDNLSTYFKYPGEIRRIIYTTNIVEGLHRQLRKVTKNKSLFPNDQALTKMIFLSYTDVAKKWNKPIPNWAYIISQFSVVFDDRIDYYLK